MIFDIIYIYSIKGISNINDIRTITNIEVISDISDISVIIEISWRSITAPSFRPLQLPPLTSELLRELELAEPTVGADSGIV